MGFLEKLITTFIGTKDERDIKELQPHVAAINDLEEDMKVLSDNALKGKTDYFKNKVEMGASLDEIMVEAFAVVREAGRRVLKMRHYDVQLIGGMVLHQGRIAEMKTGEGKTLVATLAAYLNALAGKGVHIVTVNDYLARRDAEWMGPLYNFLGMSVGVIQADMGNEERKEAYAADITYGQNNEFGFDYLRDNMKYSINDFVQRRHSYAIVDEVDSILIDEARTPLIISGPAEDSTDLYTKINRIIPKLTYKNVTGKIKSKLDTTPDTDEEEYDYLIDEKNRSATLTERGVTRCEELLEVENLFDPSEMTKVHVITQGLKAHALFKKDVDYVVKDGQVIIVDEFTGRMMEGRRWSDGLHQAVEAKEGVPIARENQTLATITFQNYFRMYDKLAGMTGTAATEAEEFGKIYSLDVVSIPTNKPLQRIEHGDVIYKTHQEKVNAIVEEIREYNTKEVQVGEFIWTGQPVLVGTVSIEKSEEISRQLTNAAIEHNVLNAKHHEKEAGIVAQAGRAGMVTIATNMAGRGTDIILGGNPEEMALNEYDPNAQPEKYHAALKKYREEWQEEHNAVVKLGGLHIVGTERHESRRVDNQLRGRAGRQGDPGSSRFFLSFDDDLMRIFGMDKRTKLLGMLGMKEGMPIEHSMVTKAVERSQTQVEQHNFSIRKHLLEYDDVMNAQRKAVFTTRTAVLSGEYGRDYIMEKGSDLLNWILEETIGGDDPDNWNHEACAARLNSFFGMGISIEELKDKNLDELEEELLRRIGAIMEEKYDEYGEEKMNKALQFIMLTTIDDLWKHHLYALDHLKEGINLRGYGGRQPLMEFKKESFEMFQSMQDEFENKIIEHVFRLRISEERSLSLEELPKKDMQFIAPQGPQQSAKAKKKSRGRKKSGKRRTGR